MYRTFYVHAHAIRSISFIRISRAYIPHYTAPIAARGSVSLTLCVFSNGETRELASRRSLILYVQYIHFRFPGLHRRFRQAAGDVDIDRLSARFKNGNHIHSNLVRYSRRNKHFCWKWLEGGRRHSTLGGAAKFDFPASQRWIFAFKKREKVFPYFVLRAQFA